MRLNPNPLDLSSFSALTLLVWVIWPVKPSPIWPITCLVLR